MFFRISIKIARISIFNHFVRPLSVIRWRQLSMSTRSLTSFSNSSSGILNVFLFCALWHYKYSKFLFNYKIFSELSQL